MGHTELCLLSIRYTNLSIPVVALSKAWFCGRPLAGIAGSNPAWGIDVFCCECCVCVLSGRSLWDGLILLLGEFYRVCVMCVWVCVCVICVVCVVCNVFVCVCVMCVWCVCVCMCVCVCLVCVCVTACLEILIILYNNFNIRVKWLQQAVL